MDTADLRQQLSDDTERWMCELDGSSSRATLSVGVVKKSFSYAEDLLRSCCATFTSGPDRDAMVNKASDGKTECLDRLTLGQCSKLLNMLDSDKRIVPKRRAIGRGDRALLDRICSARNGFTHGSATEAVEAEQVTAIISEIRRLADAQFVEIAVRIEAATLTQDDR